MLSRLNLIEIQYDYLSVHSLTRSALHGILHQEIGRVAMRILAVLFAMKEKIGDAQEDRFLSLSLPTFLPLLESLGFDIRPEWKELFG
jgi:hypothetical protein